MRLAAASLALAFALPAAAAAAVPRRGVFVPGKSLGGLRLGARPAQVRRAWGTAYGRCRTCERPTWYFNYRPFEPLGAGVEFDRGRVSAIFTLWGPRGWHTPNGVSIGDPVNRLGRRLQTLSHAECGRYYALLLRGRAGVSAFYVNDARIWGFALFTAPARPCR